MAFDTSGIRLKPCVDLFSTEASRQDASLEKIREIPLDQLVPFKDHPFKVIDDESMMDTVQSIREHGILLPLIARPMPDGKYEIVSGHRRSHAGKLAGLETMPVIVRELDDDAAVILMVDSNLQRENILPSERAFAFKMKLEAMKHQGQRNDLSLCQVGTRSRADEKLAQSVNESARTIQRYIRLTELLPELLDLVDERKLAFNSAVEVSYLNPEEQGWLAETIDSEQSAPSLSQAQRLKRFSQDGKLTEDMVLAIMSEQKKPETERVVLQSRQISQYFSPSATPKEMETSILSMLDTAKEWRSYFPEDNTLDDVNRRIGWLDEILPIDPDEDEYMPWCWDDLEARKPFTTRQDFEDVRNLVKRQIQYDDLLKNQWKYNRERLDEIVEIMVELHTTPEAAIRISGRKWPAWAIQDRLKKLTYDSLITVYYNLDRTKNDIRNIKNYLIATLMNTPITQESQFTAEYRAHPV